MHPHKEKRALLILLLAISGTAPVMAQTVTDDNTTLKQIIIFGRHSVRSPTASPQQLAQFSPNPYPPFVGADGSVIPPGYLTPHGQQAAILLGKYYGAYLLAEGLVTGNATTDIGHSYFRANSIERSNVTAAALGQGLFGGAAVGVHSFPLGQPDPVFSPIEANVAVVDDVRAANEARDIYNSGTALSSAYSGEYSLIRSVLLGYPNGTQPPPATPANVVDPTAEPIPLDALTTTATGHAVNLQGLSDTQSAIDPFVMQYTDGMPLSEVAWGQLSEDGVSQETRIATLEMKIAMGTPYLAQVQSSNAAAHILRTMKQAVLGEAIPGAFTGPTDQVVVVISSDVYIIGLAALLQTHWQLPGYQPDFCAPGGAMVFELRQSQDTGEYLVRVYYTAQSFDQLRNLTPLTLQAPPQTMQLRIPGGSQPGAGFDVKFETFQDIVTQEIGMQYVQDPATEVGPPVYALPVSQPQAVERLTEPMHSKTGR